jgi:hypothetical protein
MYNRIGTQTRLGGQLPVRTCVAGVTYDERQVVGAVEAAQLVQQPVLTQLRTDRGTDVSEGQTYVRGHGDGAYVGSACSMVQRACSATSYEMQPPTDRTHLLAVVCGEDDHRFLPLSPLPKEIKQSACSAVPVCQQCCRLNYLIRRAPHAVQVHCPA